jgi:hypothetical protein
MDDIHHRDTEEDLNSFLRASVVRDSLGQDAPIKAQPRISLFQLAVPPQRSEFLSRIESLLMLRNHHARFAQQLRSGQGLQSSRVLFPFSVRRIEKRKIRHRSCRFPLPQGLPDLALHDLAATCNPQRAQILRDQLRCGLGRLNEIDRNSPATQCFNPDRTRPGIQIKPGCSRQHRRIACAQHVKQRLPQPVRRRTKIHPAQRAQRPAPVLSCDDPHAFVTFDSPFRNFRPSVGV